MPIGRTAADGDYISYQTNTGNSSVQLPDSGAPIQPYESDDSYSATVFLPSHRKLQRSTSVQNLYRRFNPIEGLPEIFDKEGGEEMGPELLRAMRLSPASSVAGGAISNARSKLNLLRSSLAESKACCGIPRCFILWICGGVLLMLMIYLQVNLWGSSIPLGDSIGLRLRHSEKGVKRIKPCTVTAPCRFKIVADLDKDSKVVLENGKENYVSYLLSGWLWQTDQKKWVVEWLSQETQLSGKYNEGGRGMELSELVRFDDKLYSFDDRTGIVFEILPDASVVARHVLTEGDGSAAKGMKCEWATTRDGELWVGSIGKEFTSSDGKSIVSGNPFWVVSMDTGGTVAHHNWQTYYSRMRKALGAEYPGYLIHEAIAWSPKKRIWVVLPRRVSNKPYDEEVDESRGSNKMLICNSDFTEIKVVDVGPVEDPRRGFSSLKFVPGTNDDVVVALKSEENAKEGTQSSYITIFTLEGEVLLRESHIPVEEKFEGIEFDDDS